MNKYIAYYNGKQTNIEAETSYDAQRKGVEFFKPPKSRKHLVHVHICERADGSVVLHRTIE